MKVTFLFPPQWTASHPHYSVALLAGQLRRAGHEVDVVDLNLEFTELVLQERSARLSLMRVDAERDLLASELMLRQATQDRSDALELASEKMLVLREIDRRRSESGNGAVGWAWAADALRNPDEFFEPNRFIEATRAIDSALKLFSAPFYPTEVRWNFFTHPTVPFNLEPMLAFCSDATVNPFLEFFKERIDDIMARNADILAVSVSSFSQVMGGLTLAKLLRAERGKETRPHISLGGNFFSRLALPLQQSPGFFEAFADSVTIGEGEAPIIALANAIEEGGTSPAPLACVPSLVFLDSHGIPLQTPAAPQQPMADLAHQDLSVFDLERYFSPHKVVCLRASKGCYWGQCTFCDSYYGLRDDSLSIDRVVAEMRHIIEATGVRHFEFVDQCMRPEYLSSMSDAILAAGLKVNWFCNARTENGFTPEIFRKMVRAGATMVMWGLESGSQRLLKLMKKGVSIKGRLDILRASADAGLWNFAYIFFGFPTETEEEAMATINLVRENTDIIHSYGRSIFSLGKHSPLMEDPDHYGILNFVEDDEQFSTNLSHENISGLSGEDLMRIGEACTTLCREAYGDPLWMTLRSRESLHLYLSEHGRDYVQGYRFEDGDAVNRDTAFVF